jgi:hypothetical protein
MSQRHDQTLANLTYEVTQIATDQFVLCRRLNELNPDLAKDSDVQVAAQRVKRLRSMLTLLQKQAKED